ncbi:hypothetical protein C7957_10716 [Halanaerobium saccharolyticum]|uniref:Uncharacterized protein n=1 Tax=Halanaerobium saccharolyticum TaxID=43595 RepID=A0A4R6SA63_9FIRM|nr:hypothetical protein C7957_10716 [Halanaerobium saccharolyticum]
MRLRVNLGLKLTLLIINKLLYLKLKLFICLTGHLSA